LRPLVGDIAARFERSLNVPVNGDQGIDPQRRGGKMSGRNVNIGGNVVGNIIQTGDQNRAKLSYRKVELPAPESVDILAELKALQQLLAGIATEDRQKIVNALTEAAEDASKPIPNRDEIGRGLERALEYAGKAADLGDQAATIATHVQNAVAWLGSNWHKLLPLVGLAA
jgi:hypothetical protein